MPPKSRRHRSRDAGPPLVGGVETGGTTCVCAIGTGPGDMRSTVEVPTATPEATLGRALAFFRTGPPLAAVGIAAFGPLDLDPASATYGSITTTPKPGWAGTDLVGTLRARCACRSYTPRPEL